MGAPEVNGEYKLPTATYTVRKGDTLTTISKATGIPISVLAKDNNLEENPDLIVTGQTLVFKYHPQNWEKPELYQSLEQIEKGNDIYWLQFFEEMDRETQARYDTVVKDGAQAHINTKW